MTGPGVGQPARLAATGEYVFAHAGQLTQDWGQVVGQGCRAGCVHPVGNGQLAPHKIDIGPFQRGHFTPGATWQQGPRVGARASVAQLLHARPPAVHLLGLRGLRLPHCSTPGHQPATCAASGVCGCPTAPHQTTSRPPARPPGRRCAWCLSAGFPEWQSRGRPHGSPAYGTRDGQHTIAQGLLQHLAINFKAEVWRCFRSWLRTMNPGRPPSELIGASALRSNLTLLIPVPPLDASIKKK